MKIKHIVYTLIVLGIGALIFYRISENNKQKAKGNEGKKGPMEVEAVIVEPREFNNILSLSGSIEANEQVEIRSEVSGIAEKIFFEEGTKVSKGQVLVKINDIELRAQAGETATRQKLASENERRAKLLLEKEAISQEEYDIASADYKTAQAQTQLINAQIAKTSVRAPFSGTIGLRNISPGTYVTPETLIASLVNSSQVKITFSVPEKYASKIKDGAKVTFTIAGSDEKFEAKIYAIEPAIEVATRTLRVRAIAQNDKGRLIPGTFANISLPLETLENAIMIPSQAVVPVQGGKKVFTDNNGTVKEVMIETEARTDKDVVVTSGLKAGDTVLTTGVLTLKNDMPVKTVITGKQP